MDVWGLVIKKHILRGTEPSVLSYRAGLGKHHPMAPGSPGGQELQLLVPAQLDIGASLPNIPASQPHGHSCPWKQFLCVSFSWSWQEESSALITCLREAGLR